MTWDQREESAFCDRARWGHGQWAEEPDKIEWRHKGIPCLIVRNPLAGNLCGYVGLPPGHPAYGGDWEHPLLADVNVHGGVTFGSRCQENGGHICHVARPGEPEDVWWVGFDCAHCDDRCPRDEPRHTWNGYPASYRDVDYVRRQTESLADQLLAMGAG